MSEWIGVEGAKSEVSASTCTYIESRVIVIILRRANGKPAFLFSLTHLAYFNSVTCVLRAVVAIVDVYLKHRHTYVARL